MLHSFKCEMCGIDFQRKPCIARFCSIECQIKWQRSISWEDRIGKKRANEIRKEVSKRVSGSNNPTTDPKIAKKVSDALKKYFEEHDTSGELNAFYGKKHTEEYKKRQSENKRGKRPYNEEQYKKLCERTPKGDRHHNWKGGISKEPYGFDFDKQLKEQVKNKYGGKCVICNEIGKKLCSHHIDYDKYNNVIENLVPLCQSCHSKTNYHRSSWTSFFKAFLMENNDE